MRKWYLNTKTKEIDSYNECGELNDFPRGVFLAYDDYLVTGFRSKEEAENSKWVACDKCNGSTWVDKKDNTKCGRCGAKLIKDK